ncbi:MAG: hypothetical protein QM756_38155 [Polyangiaceae bacterium]
MNGAPAEAPSSAQPAAERAEAIGGVSASAFTLLALLAIVAARGIAPALPGTTTGIARWISAAGWFAACVSQLVAAGGIALCVRLLGNVFALPSLGIAFRFTVLPAGISVVALVAAAAARPLEGDLGKLLASAAIVTPAALVPFLFERRLLRHAALGIGLAAAAGVLDLASYELLRRAVTSDGWHGSVALWVSACSLLFDFAAAVLAARAVSADWRASARGVGSALLFAACGLALARLGSSHTASSALVLVQRTVEALGMRQAQAIHGGVAHFIALFELFLAATLLRKNHLRADVHAALSMMLLSRTCAGAPVASLLAVTSALLLARAVTVPNLLPEHHAAKSVN